MSEAPELHHRKSSPPTFLSDYEKLRNSVC